MESADLYIHSYQTYLNKPMYDRNLCEMRDKHYISENYFYKAIAEVPVLPERQLMKLLG